MKIAILGGSGFIGSHLCHYLQEAGHQVVIWSRSPAHSALSNNATVHIEKWPPDPEGDYADIDAVVNLAGETINQYWTKKAKERILQSRVQTTKRLVEYIKSGVLQPKVVINGSAVGYYGTSTSKQFTEADQAGNDFLAQVTSRWEEEIEQASKFGVRVVRARIGIVLDREGGALPKMLLPYTCYIGGKLGSGKQWVSWIHIQDMVRLLSFALENEAITGALNCTTPNPLRMEQFGQEIARAMHKPHWLPTPGFALRLLLGEMSTLLLQGQAVIPEQALDQGFRFRFNHLHEALEDLLM